MSDQQPPERPPVTHNVLLPQTTPINVELIATPLIVSSPIALAPALAQNSKPVILEPAEMVRVFSRIMWWSEQRARFYFVAWLIYKLLVHSVTNDYQLEADWNLRWKIAPFEGKVILTPANKPVE